MILEKQARAEPSGSAQSDGGDTEVTRNYCDPDGEGAAAEAPSRVTEKGRALGVDFPEDQAWAGLHGRGGSHQTWEEASNLSCLS